MIITCNNCNKKFDIDSNLIPDKGRLLQCAGCNHKWFFKKEVLKNTVSPVAKDIVNEGVNIFDQNKRSNNDEINPSELPMEEIEVDIEEKLDEKIEINNEEEPKKKKTAGKQLWRRSIECSNSGSHYETKLQNFIGGRNEKPIATGKQDKNRKGSLV